MKACDIVMEKGITGKQLLAMKAVDLVEELGMTASAAKLFMSRYMAWITSRVDRPPGKGKRKRKGKSSATNTPEKKKQDAPVVSKKTAKPWRRICGRPSRAQIRLEIVAAAMTSG